MVIRLVEPYADKSCHNWLLQAEGMLEASSWTPFSYQATSSDRSLFEKSVRGFDLGISPRICKEMLRPGVCCFEYDWKTPEDDVLEHGIKVARSLGLELMLGDLPLIPA